MKNSITKPMQSGSATKPMQHKPATKPTQHKPATKPMQHKPATKPMQHKPATKPVQHKPVTVVLRADSKANNAASPRLNQVTSSTALAAILAVLLLTLPSALHADSQSAFVGVGTTIIHDGQFSWNLPNYIDSIDNIYAKSYARANAGQHSYFLIGRGFKPPYSTMPLDIPHGARIDGFEVTIYRSSTAVNSIKDYSLQITSNTQDLSQ
ncbi:hypothetical protein FJZ26_00960, partial [Candidatus Parvarchaeota archaeon]|nr:hypothetical protein [Candidatus Parvarchaeota archaeon]